MLEAELNPMFDALADEGLAESTTVVLVGSGARGVRNPRSDIDVLVLYGDDRRIRLRRPGDVHLQQDSRSRFLNRLADGDDYPGWALRFGTPLRDPGGWWAEHAAAEIEKPHWPDWRPKLEHARKRIRMASDLLEVGDLDASAEELLFAASHVARAVLLKQGMFPLSRPELASQLEDVDPSLAGLLQMLIVGEMDAEGLEGGNALLRRRVERLEDGQSTPEHAYPETAAAALSE